MRRGENLAGQTSSKDSITMNLEKSADYSPSLILTGFVYFFLFEDAMYTVYFSLALRSNHPLRSPTCVGNEPRGNPFALVEMGIRDQYT